MSADPLIATLVEVRRQRGLSMREVSRRAGISAGGLSRMERGTHSPSLRNLRAWAGALGFSISLDAPAEEQP